MTTSARQRKVALVSVTLVVLSALAASWILPRLPLRPGNYPRVEYMPEFEVPDDPGVFFVHGRQPELSQSILYHGLGESMANAASADVLFIGDSRMPLGLRGEFLLPGAREQGIRLFSLGMGHVERVRFALDLIRRHDLRPRVVVAAGGPHIFKDKYSDVALEAKRMSRWGAIRNWFEAAAWWNVQFRLHRLVPKIEFFRNRFHTGYVHYRSSRTGWWHTVLEWNGKYRIRYGQDDPDYAWTLPVAVELKKELEDRGGLLVLTTVPYGGMRIGHLRYLAEELDIPFLFPQLNDLRTSDGSHLTRESARRFSAAFWEAFTALPEVREKLRATSP